LYGLFINIANNCLIEQVREYVATDGEQEASQIMNHCIDEMPNEADCCMVADTSLPSTAPTAAISLPNRQLVTVTPYSEEISVSWK